MLFGLDDTDGQAAIYPAVYAEGLVVFLVLEELG